MSLGGVVFFYNSVERIEYNAGMLDCSSSRMDNEKQQPPEECIQGRLESYDVKQQAPSPYNPYGTQLPYFPVNQYQETPSYQPAQQSGYPQTHGYATVAGYQPVSTNVPPPPGTVVYNQSAVMMPGTVTIQREELPSNNKAVCWSVVVIIFCAWFCGIVALIYASKIATALMNVLELPQTRIGRNSIQLTSQ